MSNEDILNFKNSLINLTYQDLCDKRKQLQNEVSKMILNSDLIIKIALIEAQIEEKYHG